ncbi:MAG: hypothetical protein JST84_31620 [Acidobacteria bacterium]|nr:hypothetical protein [Acidobacteriota bacterium]
MIRYPITATELEAAIEQEKQGWLAKAKKKTSAFRRAKQFNEPDSQYSWGEIKDVFIRLQHNKCAFCDRLLSGPPYGRIEHDLEHFRPKKAVKAWNGNNTYGYRFALGDAAERGYYLLAYNIFNYATSCKTCNTKFKANYFPIAGTRRLTTDDFTLLKQEQPYLVYPLGNLDDDPETLITYRGILPIPKYRNGHKYRRARITIDLFELDSREDLRRLRAEVIQKLWLAFRTLQQRRSKADAPFARRIIDCACSPQTSQVACSRAFYDLCQNDANTARLFAQEADEYLCTN